MDLESSVTSVLVSLPSEIQWLAPATSALTLALHLRRMLLRPGLGHVLVQHIECPEARNLLVLLCCLADQCSDEELRAYCTTARWPEHLHHDHHMRAN